MLVVLLLFFAYNFNICARKSCAESIIIESSFYARHRSNDASMSKAEKHNKEVSHITATTMRSGFRAHRKRGSGKRHQHQNIRSKSSIRLLMIHTCGEMSGYLYQKLRLTILAHALGHTRRRKGPGMKRARHGPSRQRESWTALSSSREP